MRYWASRADPKNLNQPFEQWVKADEIDRWWTKMPPRSWDVGDRVFIWASSPQQEILALAELHKPQANAPDEDGYFYYRLRYLTNVLASPIPRAALERNPVLKDSILLKRGPAHSVIRLTDGEGEELYRIVASHDRSVRHIWPELLRKSNGALDSLQDLDLQGSEGSKVLRQHLVAERDRRLVEAKKKAVLKATGKLDCEVCGFDFQRTYGTLGKNFCEVHHLLPLGARRRASNTKLDELAILCSNCHRIIHRQTRPLSLEYLKAALRTAG